MTKTSGMQKLSIKQIREIIHALGGQIRKNPPRNYFNTVTDNESWDELTEMGFAFKRDVKGLGVTYYVTPKAIDDLIPIKETIGKEVAVLRSNNKFLEIALNLSKNRKELESTALSLIDDYGKDELVALQKALIKSRK